MTAKVEAMRAKVKKVANVKKVEKGEIESMTAKGKKGEKVRSSCATHAPVRVRNCLPATLPH